MTNIHVSALVHVLDWMGSCEWCSLCTDGYPAAIFDTMYEDVNLSRVTSVFPHCTCHFRVTSRVTGGPSKSLALRWGVTACQCSPQKRTQVMPKTLVCCISRTVLAQPDALLCNTDLWPSILLYTFEKIGWWPTSRPTIGGYAPRRRSGSANKCLRFAKIKQTHKTNPNWPSCKPQNSLPSDNTGAGLTE